MLSSVFAALFTYLFFALFFVFWVFLLLCSISQQSTSLVFEVVLNNSSAAFTVLNSDSHYNLKNEVDLFIIKKEVVVSLRNTLCVNSLFLH